MGDGGWRWELEGTAEQMIKGGIAGDMAHKDGMMGCGLQVMKG